MTTALSAECRRVLASVSAYLDGDLDATFSIEGSGRTAPKGSRHIATIRAKERQWQRDDAF